MDAPAPLKGITTRMVETARLKMHTYFSGPGDGIPVIFLHGNFASALYWQENHARPACRFPRHCPGPARLRLD